MLHITTFAGIKPALSPWLLQPQQATVAHNCRLRDGTLQPFDRSKFVRSECFEVQGLFLPSDGPQGPAPLMAWPYPVSVTEAQGPGEGTPWEHVVVWRQDGGAPFRQDRYRPEWCWPLVVPAPTRPLKVTLLSDVDSSDEPDQRVYTYTFVDRFGVESPPAPPSPPVRAYDGSTFELDRFSTPPDSVIAVRIYRTSSKMEMGDKDGNFDPSYGLETTFQLVAERDVPFTPSSAFVDDLRLRDMEFGTLQTLDNQAPPQGMGQVVLTHEGYYVGFRGNQVFVSERHEPHNWPEKYRCELPDQVVGIVAQTHVAARYGRIMTHDVVYILTTGRPYRMSVAWKEGPHHTSDANVQPVPFDEHYRCLDKHTIVKTNDGCIYASDKGLVELKFQGPANLLTRKDFDEDYFMQVAPNIAVWQNGRYFATSYPSGRGFILDNREAKDGGKDIGDLVTIDLEAFVVHAGSDGRVYFALGEDIYIWNAAPAPMSYRWRSKVFRQPGLISYGAAKVVADFGAPVTFTLLDGTGRSMYERTVHSSAPFKLPSLAKRITWQVQLEGSTVVREIHVATTIADLADQRTGQTRDRKAEAQK